MVKPTLVCFAVFVPCLLLLTCSTNYGFSYLLLITPILIIPTTVFLFKPTEKKLILIENPAQYEHSICGPVSSREDKIEEENQVSQESDDGEANMLEYQVESLDFPSDSESESSDELKWVGSNNGSQFLSILEEAEEDDGGDGGDDADDDDDDDGLIEIKIPRNGLNEECKQDLPDFLTESMLKQQGLMELFNEVNEEESLIELDLSMGSIKGPMFEVET